MQHTRLSLLLLLCTLVFVVLCETSTPAPTTTVIPQTTENPTTSTTITPASPTQIPTTAPNLAGYIITVAGNASNSAGMSGNGGGILSAGFSDYVMSARYNPTNRKLYSMELTSYSNTTVYVREIDINTSTINAVFTFKTGFAISVAVNTRNNMVYAAVNNMVLVAINPITLSGIAFTSTSGVNCGVVIADGTPAINVNVCPTDLIYDSRNNFLFFEDKHTIRRINMASYTMHTVLTDVGLGLAVDTINNILYCTSSSGALLAYNIGTGVITTIGSFSLDSSFFAVDGAREYLYFADSSSRINVLNLNTKVKSTIAGTGANAYSGDGPAQTTSINLAGQLDYDNTTDSLYFTGPHLVRKISNVSTLVPATTPAPSTTASPVTQTPVPSSPMTTSTPTVRPTDPYCWTCPAGQVRYWTIPGLTSDDPCLCVTEESTKTPTTTKSPSNTTATPLPVTTSNSWNSTTTPSVAPGPPMTQGPAPVVITVASTAVISISGDPVGLPAPISTSTFVIFTSTSVISTVKLTPSITTIPSNSRITSATLTFEVFSLNTVVNIKITAVDGNMKLLGSKVVTVTSPGASNIDISVLLKVARRTRQVIVDGSYVSFGLEVVTPGVAVHLNKETSLSLSYMAAVPTPTPTAPSTTLPSSTGSQTPNATATTIPPKPTVNTSGAITLAFLAVILAIVLM